jgi:hypothetical protein
VYLENLWEVEEHSSVLVELVTDRFPVMFRLGFAQLPDAFVRVSRELQGSLQLLFSRLWQLNRERRKKKKQHVNIFAKISS